MGLYISESKEINNPYKYASDGQPIGLPLVRGHIPDSIIPFPWFFALISFQFAGLGMILIFGSPFNIAHLSLHPLQPVPSVFEFVENKFE